MQNMLSSSCTLGASQTAVTHSFSRPAGVLVVCVWQDFKSGGGETVVDGLAGCVLALGSKGMKAVVGGSPALAMAAPELSRAAAMGGIDVVATRIWLDRYVPTDTPANVFSRFDALRGAGGTFFMLDQLQPDEEALWGGAKPQVPRLGTLRTCLIRKSAGIRPAGLRVC